MSNFNLQNPERTLFSDTAQEWARKCSQRKGSNTSSQFRRFYDEIVYWHDWVQNASDKENRFIQADPYIQMLKAKAHYAYGRNKLLDEHGLEFIESLVNGINSVQTLENGKLLFEAFMGYKKYFEAT